MQTTVAFSSSSGKPPGGSVRQALVGHLGDAAEQLPVAAGAWAPYDHVNLQVAVDRWLEQQSGGFRLLGLTGFRHRMFGLADLLTEGMDAGMSIGGVAQVELPVGPDDEVLGCVQCGVYLVADGDARTVILMRGTDQRGPQQDVMLEIVSTRPGDARRILAQLRALAVEHSVYRRQILSFGGEVFGPGRAELLSFHRRPAVGREDLVLPDGLLDGIERQIIGVAEHRDVLLAHGQHLKRGVLLHGAPGVGKTHTVRYLMSRLPDTTVLILSGSAMRLIREACSIARTLAPALLVVEDVDLIAEERGPHTGFNPLLFQLLNEMDGLGEDIDVTFVLTTNRVDVLEPALAARPGRIDHAVEIPLPDAEGRRRLLAVYRGGLELELAEPERVIDRTEGVTASFIKELLRRAALTAADEAVARNGETVVANGEAVTRAPLRVTDHHLHAALDILLDDRNVLTRRLLGAQTRTAPDAA
jgi:cell division protease FtsH